MLWTSLQCSFSLNYFAIMGFKALKQALTLCPVLPESLWKHLN